MLCGLGVPDSAQHRRLERVTHKARRMHVYPSQLALPFPAIDAASIPEAGQDMTESEGRPPTWSTLPDATDGR